MADRRYFVYIMASKPNGTLYVGVTNDLARHGFEHKSGAVPGFTRKYDVKTLVYYEVLETIESAIQREKTIKHYVRAWKLNLIETKNPTWRDLSDELV